MNSVNLNNKLFIYEMMNRLASNRSQLKENLKHIYHPQATWRGSHPFNEIKGVQEIQEKFWVPFQESFPDLERRDFLMIGGEYENQWFVGCVGHFCGTFRKTWLDIPATGKTIYHRYGEFHRLEEGKIIQSTVLIDILDCIRQAGYWPLPPSLGVEEMWVAPITGDGLVFTETDPEESAQSLKLTLDMHQSLYDYDYSIDSSREGLLNMSQKDYWHPQMMWYGPSGIGTTRGLQGFVDHHQHPFRKAFPNRKGVGHYVRIGDGKFSATSGWPSVHGQHFGGNWLGTSPTGRDIYMRVMDFYLADEGLIRENWVPIDIINILLQMDIDIFQRLDYAIHPEKYC